MNNKLQYRLFLSLYTILIIVAGLFSIEVVKACTNASTGLGIAIYVFITWIVVSWLEELIDIFYKLLNNVSKAKRIFKKTDF